MDCTGMACALTVSRGALANIRVVGVIQHGRIHGETSLERPHRGIDKSADLEWQAAVHRLRLDIVLVAQADFLESNA